MKKILFFLIPVLFMGCKTGKVIVPVVDTLYINKTIKDTVYQSKYDSVYFKDSIYIREKGDSVFIDKWHTQYKYKVDTSYIYKERVDTIYQVKNVIVETEKKLTKWQKFKMDAGGLLVGAVVALLVALVVMVVRKVKARVGSRQ